MDTPQDSPRAAEYIEREKAKRRQLVLALRRIAKTKEGKIVWAHLKGWTGLTKSAWDHECNTHRAALREGKRLVAIHLLDLFTDRVEDRDKVTITTTKDERTRKTQSD